MKRLMIQILKKINKLKLQIRTTGNLIIKLKITKNTKFYKVKLILYNLMKKL